MKNNTAKLISIKGIIGKCGALEVFLGFASANLLYLLSFADTLNEETCEGYQRPYNYRHSLDFKKYIMKNQSSTIPLTFNLRPELSDFWQIERISENHALLHLSLDTKSLAQIDCQHRLGELKDIEVPLAFMTYVGLDLRKEMSLFVIINSKAKGLSSSLTDFHESNIIQDLIIEAPHLYLARRLNEDPDSPWYKMIRYGGETTSGLKRRTSFRMMQKTLHKYLKQIKDIQFNDIENIYKLIVSFWCAVRTVYDDEWNNHRHNLLTKGVGLYSLTLLLAEITCKEGTIDLDEKYFINKLQPMENKIDWSSKGMFAHAGGQKGAVEVFHKLREYIDI